MSSNPDPRDEKSSLINGNTIGIVFLVVAFCVSLVISIKNTLTVERPLKPVLRIAHWQLEAGYRDALQAIIDDYSKLHPEIDVVQMPVTESVYKQWINTQLISGTAPDICELGQSDLLSKDEGTVRYFMPLSGEITKPNKYNKGTDLENTPWKETILDGMRGGFRAGLQDYYGVPTTLSTMRVFYNKQLLSKAVALYNDSKPEQKAVDGAPATFGQWMTQCKALKAYAAAKDPAILPIVSCYGIFGIQQQFEIPFTANIAGKCDLDLDGITTEIETYVGYLNHTFDLENPNVKAVFEATREVGDQMQQGFSGMDRQTAQFRFVNGQSGFLWTGSWDAKGCYMQAQRKGFDVGIFKVPIPGPDEKFGNLVVGNVGETITGIGTYGISKTSPNTEAAVDFLRFLSSQKENEKLNSLAEWPPLTLGAKPSELMAPFTVDLRGVNGRLAFSVGSRVNTVYTNQLLNYYQGDDTFATFAKQYTDILVDPNRGGDWQWWFLYDQRDADERNTERLLAQTQTLDLLNPDGANPARYRRAVLQQVSKNNGLDYLYLFKKYRGFDMPMH